MRTVMTMAKKLPLTEAARRETPEMGLPTDDNSRNSLVSLMTQECSSWTDSALPVRGIGYGPTFGHSGNPVQFFRTGPYPATFASIAVIRDLNAMQRRLEADFQNQDRETYDVRILSTVKGCSLLVLRSSLMQTR